MLIVSVLATVVLGIILTLFIPKFGSPGKSVGFIILANVIVFLIVDMGKVGFRYMIGDGNVEVIKTSDLIELPKEEETEATKALKKRMRYEVHRGSVVAEEDRAPSVVSFDTSTLIGKIRAASTVTDGFIKRGGKASFDARSSVRR